MRIPKIQVVWMLLILILSSWVFYSLYFHFHFQNLSHLDKLQKLWIQDVKKLEKFKAVPAGWYKLKEVTYFGGDPTAKNWIIEGLRAPHPVNDDGTHRLEVLLLSFEDEGRNGAIIQYNLVHLKSNNMEWELGRTFFLSNKQSEWEEWLEISKEKIKKIISAQPKKIEAAKVKKAPLTQPSTSTSTSNSTSNSNSNSNSTNRASSSQPSQGSQISLQKKNKISK